LPQHGWPYAVAKTTWRPDPARPDTRLGILRLDPKVLRVAQPGDVDAKHVLELSAPLGEGIGTLALYHDGSRFVIAAAAPPGAVRITRGFARDEAASGSATSAMGVDAEGMLVFVRFTSGARPGGEGTLLSDALKRLGCASALFFLRPLGAVFGDQHDAVATDPNGARPDLGISLARAEGPGARRLFPDTPVVLPTRWAPLQQKRVHYP
jgi:hypothetical protein